MNVLVYIRLLYNKAIREGIVKRKHYPFGAGKVKIKFPESEKIGLTTEEILTIERLTDLTELEIHARNVWLYCFISRESGYQTLLGLVGVILEMGDFTIE